METIIEILLDNSMSMGPYEVDKGNKAYLLPDGSTRMELAKKVLADEIIPQFDHVESIAIQTFYQKKISEKESKLILEEVFSGAFNKDEVITKIRAVDIPTNTGSTPISAALEASIEKLAKHPDADRKIILITDGEEDEGSDFRKTAKEALAKRGISCNIFIIGIAQSSNAAIATSELANSTGGGYVNLPSITYDKQTLQASLRPLYFKAINTTLQNLGKGKKEQSSEPAQAQTPLSTENDKGTLIEEHNRTLRHHSTTLNLISKQLASLHDAISNLQTLEAPKNSGCLEVEENTALNESIRIASESYLYLKLKEQYGQRLHWVNEKAESGLPYDFEVIDSTDNSKELFIECKGSMYAEKVFYMTQKEWEYFLDNMGNYRLYFISSALTNPQLTKITNLLEWILKKKVIPMPTQNIKLKASRIVLSVCE